MEPKKNPKVDLARNSGPYFAIGLCLVLFLSWKLVEYKSYDKSTIDIGMLNVADDEIEDVPLTEQLKTPPPPPPPAVVTQVLEVVKDEEDVEETVIESTETTQEEIIKDVEVMEEEVEADVPLFPGCERVKKSERRKCFQEKMDKHVLKNFRYPEIAQEMGIQGRVYVQFVIDKDGTITGIRARGPDKNLEKEALRIMGKLPTMTPGKQRGRAVRVPFSYPINFRLQQ
ncbi:MAG: energy transducer TonB [Flavobacteriaceae bacterium]|nr:energy transducer TonB [Flavobacteriaceae bacterium]